MRRLGNWRPGRQQGFTMIEALLVVIILGVVGTLAFPAMERGVARSKADRAAFAMSGELSNAFSLAERQRKTVRIAISTANRTITISDVNSGTRLAHRDFSNARSPFGLTAMTTTANTVDVYPTGIATAALTMTLTVGTNTRTITMTRVGQVRVQ